MKILFDTRQYVFDQEVATLATHAVVYVLERVGIHDAGAVSGVKSIPVVTRGSGVERILAKCGFEITLPTYISRYHAIMTRVQPDLIVAGDFFRLSSLQALWYKRANPSVRLILLCETKRLPQRRFSKWFMQFMLSVLRRNTMLVEQIVVYTEEAEAFMRTAAPDIRVTLVPPTVDTELFVPKRQQPFLVNGVLHVVMNARYVTYKRHAVLFAAVRMLRNEGYKVVVTCIGRDADKRDLVEELVQQYDLEDQIYFHDPVPKEQLSDLYGRHDLLVLPSYNEALGMVVPEAMASGIGTITSDTVGANIYVLPGKTGYIFHTDESTDLSDQLRRCFDVNILQQMGGAARVHIEAAHAYTLHQDRFAAVIVGSPVA